MRTPPASDHWDGRAFTNPGGAPAGKALADVWRLARAPGRQAWPARVVDPAYPPAPADVPAGHVAVTFVGHATFLLRFAGGLTVLTDPMFSERASPLGWLGPRRARAPGVALDALPPLDLILLSHNHYDHLDLPSLRALRGAPIITGLGNGAYLARHGVPGAVELDWWEGSGVAGVEVTYLPAWHGSARGLRDRNHMLWGGFAVRAGGVCVYFAGDTAWGPHFAEIARRVGPFDVALVPIGAYDPRWFMASVHMNPEEAVRAHAALGAPVSLAMHHGTFQLTHEAIEAPVRALEAARAAAGVEPAAFRVIGCGETMVLPGAAPAAAATPG